jgi:drug/metabolite transporter (DMT)-like permease
MSRDSRAATTTDTVSFAYWLVTVGFVPMAYALGLTYALIAALLSISSRTLQRFGDYSLNVTLLGSALGAIVLAPFVDWQAARNLDWTCMVLFFFSATFWAAMVLADFKAYSAGEAGLNALCSSLITILTVGTGWFLFREPLTARDIFAVLLILTGIFTAISKRTHVTRRFVMLRMTSVVCAVVALAIDKALTQRTAISLVMWAGYALPGLACLPLWRSWHRLHSAHLGPLSLTVLLYVLAGPALIFALGLGDLGKSLALGQLRVPLTVLLGALLLNEKSEFTRKLLGACTAFAGAALLMSQ